MHWFFWVLLVIGGIVLLAWWSITASARNYKIVLELLKKAGEDGLYGLDMVKASNGTLKKGMIYVDLSRMQDLSLIDSKAIQLEGDREGDPPRRRYWITEKGKVVLANEETSYTRLTLGLED